MLFRGLTVALLGLGSLIQALPLARRQGTFTLGDPLPSDATEAILEIEVRLEYLQDQAHLTKAERQEEGGLKALLWYVYGITSIEAPDGTTTTISISTRQSSFTFGAVLPDDETEALDELQVSLEALQDKDHKTRADNELIGAIQALLFYQYHITSEYAPAGTTTVITPGRRQVLAGSQPSLETEALDELQLQLEQLEDKPDKTYQDWELIVAIQYLLKEKYGITSEYAPPGVGSTITPGKRQLNSFGIGSGSTLLPSGTTIGTTLTPGKQ